MEVPADLEERSFDLLVVGGGINGAAIARDAALRGLSVLLVERCDWGSGTSAKSSKLAHGGLRYLELLEFGLVHEALQDRERLFRQAPHLVQPLRFLYPIYPHVAARRAVRAGLLLYDILSHGKSVPGRDYMRREAALEMAPGLNPTGLVGGALFYDGQIQHVERLVCEQVVDAKTHGAVALNHTALVEFLLDPHENGQRVAGAVLRMSDGRIARVRCRLAVNATGAWVDETLGALAQGKPPMVRKTKGIHLVVPRFTDVALLIKAASDGRTFFILPWRSHCVIGTTDTDYVGDPADAAATAEDVAYLLDEAARYFPAAPLDRIEYTYAGVRALVNEDGITESNVTRRHIIYEHETHDGIAGLWSLQGGKITTARTLAEEVVDRACRRLGRARLAKLHPTREARLPGGPSSAWSEFRDQAVWEAITKESLPEATAKHLVETYGVRWHEVVLSDTRPEARRPIQRGFPHIFAEVTFAVRNEDATSVGDAMLRRTDLGLAADGNPVAARAVADWMGGLCGWDPDRREAELGQYARETRTLTIPEVTVQALPANG